MAEVKQGYPFHLPESKSSNQISMLTSRVPEQSRETTTTEASSVRMQEHWSSSRDRAVSNNSPAQTRPMRLRFISLLSPDLYETGLSAQLTKSWSSLRGPNIQRYIRPLSRIKMHSPIFMYLSEDDIAGVQELLSKGEASPFDCNGKVLDYAAWGCAPKTYRSLLDQGAGSGSLHPRSTHVVSLTTYLPDHDAFCRMRQCFDILSMVHKRRLNSV